MAYKWGVMLTTYKSQDDPPSVESEGFRLRFANLTDNVSHHPGGDKPASAEQPHWDNMLNFWVLDTSYTPKITSRIVVSVG